MLFQFLTADGTVQLLSFSPFLSLSFIFFSFSLTSSFLAPCLVASRSSVYAHSFVQGYTAYISRHHLVVTSLVAGVPAAEHQSQLRFSPCRWYVRRTGVSYMDDVLSHMHRYMVTVAFSSRFRRDLVSVYLDGVLASSGAAIFSCASHLKSHMKSPHIHATGPTRTHAVSVPFLKCRVGSDDRLTARATLCGQVRCDSKARQVLMGSADWSHIRVFLAALPRLRGGHFPAGPQLPVWCTVC